MSRKRNPSLNVERRRLMQGIAGGAAIALGAPAIAIAQEFGSKADVVFIDPSREEFATHRMIYNKRIAHTPKLIALCSQESGVVRAVHRARNESLQIAIKSGGHSFEGFSMNDGGMVIDLSPMNGLALAADHTLRAGPGCRLSEVYDYVLPRGRLLPAGTCGGVGLAGLTLGGGYGLFSRKFGLTCDSLKRVRLVDGNGEVHDSFDAPELLWACRGGGTGGLGIVTQFQYATHAAPKVLHSFRFRYRISTAQDALSLASHWSSVARELPAEAYSAFVANSKTITILVTTFSSSTSDRRMSKALALLAGKASKVEQTKSEPVGVGIRRYSGQKGPLFFKNASGGFYDSIEDMGSAAPAIFQSVLEQPGIIFQINTFGPLPPAPESAFPHRAFAFIGELQAYWDKPEAADRALDTIARLQAALTAAGVHAHYANYPDLNLRNWAHAYYGEKNYVRLQALKAQYDPADVLRHEQSIRLRS
jgi:FAD/FMN-containing dehydrogenase